MKVTLDDIRQAAEAKYGDYEIELADGSVCVLRNGLRLSKDDRKKLRAVQASLNAEHDLPDEATDEQKDQAADQAEAAFPEFVRVVAANRNQASKLLKEIGGDNAVLAHLINDYQNATQPGEASSSASSSTSTEQPSTTTSGSSA